LTLCQTCGQEKNRLSIKEGGWVVGTPLRGGKKGGSFRMPGRCTPGRVQKKGGQSTSKAPRERVPVEAGNYWASMFLRPRGGRTRAAIFFPVRDAVRVGKKGEGRSTRCAKAGITSLFGGSRTRPKCQTTVEKNTSSWKIQLKIPESQCEVRNVRKGGP